LKIIKSLHTLGEKARKKNRSLNNEERFFGKAGAHGQRFFTTAVNNQKKRIKIAGKKIKKL
jgi:hypothetical protein